MLARVFEATGLSTVQISLLREHTEKVRPPRALFCPFPYGLAFGFDMVLLPLLGVFLLLTYVGWHARQPDTVNTTDDVETETPTSV